ncbi:MAG: phosphatase PAP2 family protein [Patescibacteria group bacterium]
MSWSEKLFLKINSIVGKNKSLDFVMYFFAHALIYILIAIVLFWGAFFLFEIDPTKFDFLLKLLLTTVFFAFIFNYSIALIWRHPRPILEKNFIKVSLQPLVNWKSFPSDHATVSFIFFFIPVFLGINIYFGIFLFLLAFLVSVGRVYVGVHYPRDIIGGFFVALFLSLSSFWLLENITQVLYNYLKVLFF